MATKTLLYGSILNQNKPPVVSNGLVKLNGEHNEQRTSFLLNQDVLSKHSMLIGGTGCGKTTLFYHFINQIKNRMTSNDVMVIFTISLPRMAI